MFRNINRLSERVLLPYTLILSYNFIRGDFSKVWQCFGLATRLMTGLQLNWDGSASGHSQGGEARTFQQQESMRRVAWHIFTMDRFLAEGYDEYLSCPTENMRIRLPCNEDAFWEDRPVTAPRLTDKSPKPRDMGLHALNVRMVDLHYRIKRWTKMLESSDGTVEPSKIMGGLNALQNELTHFHTLLPDDMRLSDHSVMKYMALPERSSYTFLHSRISAGHIELYRFALPGILPPGRDHVLHRLPDEFVSRCRKQAVGHALCLGRLFTCIQDEADKHQARGAGSGGVFLAGDCSLPQIAGLALRVLLVAIECRIYDDLTEGSTSPLWRFQQPDEPHVLSLIEGGILRASAPFSPILMPCEKEVCSPLHQPPIDTSKGQNVLTPHSTKQASPSSRPGRPRGSRPPRHRSRSTCPASTPPTRATTPLRPPACSTTSSPATRRRPAGRRAPRHPAPATSPTPSTTPRTRSSTTRRATTARPACPSSSPQPRTRAPCSPSSSSSSSGRPARSTGTTPPRRGTP